MSKLLKGQAGTIVKLSIKRGNETLEIPVTREEIKLKNVLIVVRIFTKDQQNRKKQKITFVPEVVLQLITTLTKK
jgi:C-terminal processing protease CtpA/Prc